MSTNFIDDYALGAEALPGGFAEIQRTLQAAPDLAAASSSQPLPAPRANSRSGSRDRRRWEPDSGG